MFFIGHIFGVNLNYSTYYLIYMKFEFIILVNEIQANKVTC